MINKHLIHLLPLLGLAGSPAWAGEATSIATDKNPKEPIALPPAADTNPLSFFDGRLVFDFQERLRLEIRENNFDFNSGVDSLTDDSWLLQRVRFGVKVKPFDWLTFYAQGQDVREIGSDRPNTIGVMGAEGDDTFDLRQAWVEIGDPKKFSLKLGRQVLLYGDERLVGPLEWANQSRTFDAAKLHFEQPDWWVDAFTSSVVKFDKNHFNQSDWIDDSDTRDQFFSGVYFSTTWLPVQTTDIYAFELHESATPGHTDFVALGTRGKADPKKLGGWEYDYETVAEVGKLRGKDLSAFAGHAGFGFNWLDAPWKPRVYAEYAYGSGDGNARDGKVNTFQNLFPTNHPFYGYMDLFSWENMHNPAVSFRVRPCKSLTAKLDYHLFWLANTNDFWYRANGVTPVRPIHPGASNYAGSELDLTVNWKPCKFFGFQTGYSHFFNGDYLKATGPHSDADFGYAMATIEF